MALTDNIVSYWKLDESSGNAADSVSTNTLTNTNSATFVSGKINNGADLESGSTQYFAISDASQAGLDITGSLSITAWINIESTASGNDYVIVGKWTNVASRAYRFAINNNAGAITLVYNFGDSGQKSVSWSPSTATWYFVGVTYNSGAGEVKFYVDGSQQGATQTSVTDPPNVGAAFSIGSRGDGGDPFDGIIDETGIWSRDLSGAEITTLYNGGTGIQYPFTITTSIKTFNGLANASTKTVNGLARASVKTWNGLQ